MPVSTPCSPTVKRPVLAPRAEVTRRQPRRAAHAFKECHCQVAVACHEQCAALRMVRRISNRALEHAHVRGARVHRVKVANLNADAQLVVVHFWHRLVWEGEGCFEQRPVGHVRSQSKERGSCIPLLSVQANPHLLCVPCGHRAVTSSTWWSARQSVSDGTAIRSFTVNAFDSRSGGARSNHSVSWNLNILLQFPADAVVVSDLTSLARRTVANSIAPSVICCELPKLLGHRLSSGGIRTHRALAALAC